MSDTADLIHDFYSASLPPALWSEETPSAPKAKRVRSAVLPAAEVEVTEVEVES